MKGNKVLNLLKEYAILSLACCFFAICWESFMIPNDMSAGGIMGLSTIIQYATGGVLPAQYTYIAINAILIIVAVIVMGIGFGFKTIYCIVVSTLIMQLVDNAEWLHCAPGQFLFVQEKLLIPIIGGFFEALGIGLVIKHGGSTGGTDILALMINKYWPVSLGTTFLVSDFVICGLLLFLPGKNFSDMIYGIVEVVTFSMMIDMVVGGKKSSYQLLVFSEKYAEIADHIINVMDRGVTVLDAQGWYTKKDRNVLLILISQKELHQLMTVIKHLDPKAFMSVSSTNSVYGEGFEEIKTGLKK